MTKTPKVEIPSKPFIAKVSITSASYLLRIPFYGNSDISVDWGDGNKETFSGYIESPSHTYDLAGDYIITITGTVENMATSYNGSGGYVNLYYSWTLNLISIIKWGELGLINMNRACYDCRNLVSIPNTPLGNPNVTTFDSTFYGCRLLTEIPSVLFSSNKSVTIFSNTFAYCTGLNSIPDHLFDSNTAVTDFISTFHNCSSLTEIPSGLFDQNKAVINFNYTFSALFSLTKIPPGLFDQNKAVINFKWTFYRCNVLTGTDAIPDHLFDSNTAVESFESTFYQCSGLIEIPGGLFDFNTSVTSFNWTFYDCTGLTGTTPKTGTIELWQRVGVTGTKCFYGCIFLSNYSSIPSGWK